MCLFFTFLCCHFFETIIKFISLVLNSLKRKKKINLKLKAHVAAFDWSEKEKEALSTWHVNSADFAGRLKRIRAVMVNEDIKHWTRLTVLSSHISQSLSISMASSEKDAALAAVPSDSPTM